MKYISMIVAIFILLTVVTLYAIWPSSPSLPQDTLMTINGYPLTRTTIQQIEDKETHHGNKDDSINEAITRQLLIAEAQRRGIDKENEFRNDLKNYYEHSLIKVLMEHVEDSMHAEVSDKEIDTYLQAFGKIYTFSTLEISKEVTAKDIISKGHHYSRPFNDLSSSMQLKLAIMHPGETAVMARTGNEKLAIYLQKIEGTASVPPSIDKPLIKHELQQAKIETQINNWIKELRQKAKITYITNNTPQKD